MLEEDDSAQTKDGDCLDEIVSLSHRKKRSPTEQIIKKSVGYVDTDAEELGAVPMKGKNRHEWKKIQQVTFTNWVSDRVSGSKGGTKVKDLQKDFQNGVVLIQLLENLSKKKIHKVVKDPRVTAQKFANLDLAFEFMQAEKVKIVGIGGLFQFNYIVSA